MRLIYEAVRDYIHNTGFTVYAVKIIDESKRIIKGPQGFEIVLYLQYRVREGRVSEDVPWHL